MTTRLDAHRWELLRNSPIKVQVRAATTAVADYGTAFAAGQVVDGVTLVVGDRLLVKDQSPGAQNGIVDVQASGPPVRSFDMDVSSEVAGTILLVLEGTANGGKLFKNTNIEPFVLETTPMTFVEIAGSGAPTTVDYLVGTASADLSAEIVVGTTPGGELGGTWASPTVDSSHSGSTHAATQAAAEATAATALSGHVADTTSAHAAVGVDITDTGSYYTSTTVEGALQEIGAGGIGGGGGSAITVQDEGSSLATAATTINFVGAGVTASGTGGTKTVTIPGGGTVDAATISALGFVGPILMTDGITDPPEPMWNEAGDDYLYADLG